MAGPHVALTLAALVALLPKIGHADGSASPVVDLTKIHFEADSARAPLASGGEAELTLDPELQRAARRLLARARPLEGAVTLVQAATGRILVWAEATRPGAAPGSVLLRSQAPAASVFKMVTTAALLERGKVRLDTEVCTVGGSHSIERRHLETPRRARSICAPFKLALGHSRNAAYAQLAHKYLSRDDLADTARRFGFNQKLPFEAPIQLGTLELPTGDLPLARASAGFQGSTLSPLGAAQLAYVVAAGGRSIRLQIVKHSEGYDAPERREMAGRVTDGWTAHRMERMMEVTTRAGTSAEVFNPPGGGSYFPGMRVAGKTGTLGPGSREGTTSWFIGFAPSRKPEVVVSVLLVNGGVWREKANEVARDLLRVYFVAQGRNGVTDPFGDSGRVVQR